MRWPEAEARNVICVNCAAETKVRTEMGVSKTPVPAVEKEYNRLLAWVSPSLSRQINAP
jgi:hypothetical protein